MIRNEFKLFFHVGASNNGLNQDMIVLSYFSSYHVHQTSPQLFTK